MAYFDQEQFDIRCEWGLPGVRRLAPAEVSVIVDVLSFSTSVDVALGRGAIVLPYRWRDDSAAEYARQRGAELAGSRKDIHARYSLSPSSLIGISPGIQLVLPSPNGSSLAFEAMRGGATVVAGCLRNAAAVANWAQQIGKRITVVPAGERWPDGSLRPAIEDLIGAGSIIKGLKGRRSPESQAAVDSFDGATACLRERLLACSSGRELAESGFAGDVELAAQLNVSKVVPVLKGEAFISTSGAVIGT
jgi:2-phosphosulfolactate phosphatase